MPALRIRVGLVVNPLINGFAAISFMPARSAPSANSFTFSAFMSLMRAPSLGVLLIADRIAGSRPPLQVMTLLQRTAGQVFFPRIPSRYDQRSEEHTSELQSHSDLVCRLLLEKKKKLKNIRINNHKT